MNDIEKFKNAFSQVRDMGFIDTNRKGNTGIGKTLEDIMGIPENNIDAPDLHGFEIKAQRAFSGSYVTLFTRAPTWPKAANTFLREEFGTPDRKAPEMKVLHTSMFGDTFNTHKSGFGFKLDVSHSDERIYLRVKNAGTGEIHDSEIYWSFEVIDKILAEKLNKLVFVQAATRKNGGVEQFDFKKATMYFGTSRAKFLELLEKRMIMFDIRIGVYRQGNSAGKTHDHGSGFRLKKTNFTELFDHFEEI